MFTLAFHELAEKEWRKLAPAVREQFKKKLAERLVEPRVQADALRGMPDCYKIKLRAVGYRLVYEVADGKVRVLRVLAVGKRDKKKPYLKALQRLE